VYSTCLFCHASLGANQVIEHLPIGRRLAFDSAQGRLWVVCAKCRRWNLTPIEERWEAIEECERQYRTARVRASTDEIGLARLPEGLELVHIGKPPRAELAAWRYVDAFRRRRQQAVIAGAVSVAAVAGLVAGGFAVVGTGALTSLIINGYNFYRNQRVVHRIVDPSGQRINLRANGMRRVRWVPSVGGTLAIELPRRPFREPRRMLVEGEEAERALRPILAHLNRYAGRTALVQEAVERLNRDGDPIVSGATVARRVHLLAGIPEGDPIPLWKLRAPDRLALEMSLAERDEQRLLEGELAGLQLAWREAEEIAAIADNLLLPESVTAWLRRQKSTQDRSTS
jgi:hypothetical protein